MWGGGRGIGVRRLGGGWRPIERAVRNECWNRMFLNIHDETSTMTTTTTTTTLAYYIIRIVHPALPLTPRCFFRLQGSDAESGQRRP